MPLRSIDPNMLPLAPYLTFPVAVVLVLQSLNVPTIESLGIGGIIAGFIFYFYRQDRKDSEKRLAQLGETFKTVLQENTAALTANRDATENLKDMIESMKEGGGFRLSFPAAKGKGAGEG